MPGSYAWQILFVSFVINQYVFENECLMILFYILPVWIRYYFSFFPEKYVSGFVVSFKPIHKLRRHISVGIRQHIPVVSIFSSGYYLWNTVGNIVVLSPPGVPRKIGLFKQFRIEHRCHLRRDRQFLWCVDNLVEFGGGNLHAVPILIFSCKNCKWKYRNIQLFAEWLRNIGGGTVGRTNITFQCVTASPWKTQRIFSGLILKFAVLCKRFTLLICNPPCMTLFIR